ncbi:universal stress protein [Rhodococcus sp. NPDC058521]|uniref:universal stress protein n=1 Tax=Rhodococcus sp. NPDC058521 TaxID=3346536 RepID=UPI003661F6C0
MTTAPIRHGIVAGIDGSDNAVDAARWAVSAAARFGEPVYLTHVVRGHKDLEALGDGEVPTRDTYPDSHALLDAAEHAVRDGQSDLVIERRIRPGPPAKALVDLSRTARMLVLGPAETTEMQSVFVGSNVVRVANHAKCPVVVWRGPVIPAGTDERPIVVGVDGSDLSNLAVSHAFEFASFFDAPLVAVHTWSEHSSLGGYSEARRFTDWAPHEEHENVVLAEALAGWCEKYPDVSVTRSVQRGGPMKVLLEHSAEARMVVVGSHGRNPFMASVVGSTSQALIHRAWCPILICREG